MPQSLEKQASKVLEVLGDGQWWDLRQLHLRTAIKMPDLDLALARLGEMVQSKRAWGSGMVNGRREVVRVWRLNPENVEV